MKVVGNVLYCWGNECSWKSENCDSYLATKHCSLSSAKKGMEIVDYAKWH